MNTFTKVEDALYHGTLKALVEYFPLQLPTTPIVFSHSAITEPDSSYVVINVLNMDQIGQAYTSTLANDADQLTIKASYEVFVQFSFCGSLAPNMSNTFAQQLNNIVVLDEYRRNKLGVMRKSNIRRSPQKRDTEWINFFNIDVTFSYELRTQQLVDIVEAVLMQDLEDGSVFTIPPNIIITP